MNAVKMGQPPPQSFQMPLISSTVIVESMPVTVNVTTKLYNIKKVQWRNLYNLITYSFENEPSFYKTITSSFKLHYICRHIYRVKVAARKSKFRNSPKLLHFKFKEHFKGYHIKEKSLRQNS